MALFSGLKAQQAAAQPHQKSSRVWHPLNAPVTMPMRGGRPVFPEHFEEFKYVGPTLEMVPKEIMLGVDRRPGVVGRFEWTHQVDDVTVQEDMTASLADLKAYHDLLLSEGRPAQAHKIAVLAEQAANGIP